MKISVIGTFVRDEIYPWNSTPVNSIGGIFYTISYLANLTKNDEIWPVSNVGFDFYDEVLEKLGQFNNVRTDCIKRIELKNTKVKLEYTSPTKRDETTTPPMPALQIADIEGIFDSDSTIVNLITGTDLKLSAFQHLRENSKSILYLDLHSRTLGIEENGKRYPQKPDDWIEWFRYADVVQMNEDEACLLGDIQHDEKSLIEFGEKVLEVNPSICHITLAEKGSFLFYKSNGEHKFLSVKTKNFMDVVDVIGCGDAFEAAFSLYYMKKHDIVEATRFANKIAAENCRFFGSSGISSIRKYMIN